MIIEFARESRRRSRRRLKPRVIDLEGTALFGFDRRSREVAAGSGQRRRGRGSRGEIGSSARSESMAGA